MMFPVLTRTLDMFQLPFTHEFCPDSLLLLEDNVFLLGTMQGLSEAAPLPRTEGFERPERASHQSFPPSIRPPSAPFSAEADRERFRIPTAPFLTALPIRSPPARPPPFPSILLPTFFFLFPLLVSSLFFNPWSFLRCPPGPASQAVSPHPQIFATAPRQESLSSSEAGCRRWGPQKLCRRIFFTTPLTFPRSLGAVVQTPKSARRLALK